MVRDGFGDKFFCEDNLDEGPAEIKEKSLEEQWAEAHEDHEVFKPGLQVRVAYECLLHKLRYGEVGLVLGHVGGEVCVRLEKISAPVVMPAKILLSNSGAPKFKPLQTFLRKPQSEKQDMLRVVGVSDPTVEQIEVLLPSQAKLTDAEVDYFGHCCRWSLGLDEVREVQLAPCQLVGLLLDGYLEVEGSMGYEDPEAQQKRLRVCRNMYEVSQLMLVPIRGLHPEHFTLLVISKGDEEGVRYYDSLNELHEDCLRLAHYVLRILDIKFEIKTQFNESRQSGL